MYVRANMLNLVYKLLSADQIMIVNNVFMYTFVMCTGICLIMIKMCEEIDNLLCFIFVIFCNNATYELKPSLLWLNTDQKPNDQVTL